MNKHAFIVYEMIIIIFSQADTSEKKSFASSDFVSITSEFNFAYKRHEVFSLPEHF